MTEHNWSPTETEIKTVASAALNQSEKNDVKVLVYWENDPNLMIFDPFFFANTDYVKKKYTCEGRSVEVIIGKVD
tara:strand:+ start:227 stop:451 length:225 start_codon:yes stop_codon:yes gene_type:complete